MSNYEVIKAEPASESEVLDLISNKEKNVELTYREEKTLEFLKKFSRLDIKKFKEARDELLALEIPRLEEEHIIKIIDLAPKNGTELRTIVSHSGTVLVDESVTKILDVVKKYN